MNIICFHNPDEENGYLSNWYLSDFIVNGVKFTSMEQYMMYQKAVCFHDGEIASQILDTNDVAQIKALGRLVAGYNEHHWNGVRQIIVYNGLIAKFSQNQDLKAMLIDTGDALLAECAVKDRIWGIGLSMKDPDRLDQSKWNGQNLLGYGLVLAREHLRYSNLS
ncbi:MAG: NADAR family protein [Ruminococcus flavefaciens]|nr:NADAR family protein [Ruminococcus flavefaciens]